MATLLLDLQVSEQEKQLSLKSYIPYLIKTIVFKNFLTVHANNEHIIWWVIPDNSSFDSDLALTQNHLRPSILRSELHL